MCVVRIPGTSNADRVVRRGGDPPSRAGRDDDDWCLRALRLRMLYRALLLMLSSYLKKRYRAD